MTDEGAMNPSTRNPSSGIPIAKPASKPASPLFSTGPTRKRPGWTAEALETASLGRSHRATHPKSRIKDCIARIHRVLQLPDDYITAIVPGSDTGAVEMAMWSLLGQRGVDVLGWEATRDLATMMRDHWNWQRSNPNGFRS